MARTRDECSCVVLFDGQCAFCTAQARRLARLAGGRLVLRSFRDDGVLEGYPALTRESCMEEMKLIGPTGRVHGGAEAIVRGIAAGHPVVGRVLFVYYIPGIRWMADRAYAWVASNRYRFGGAKPECCDTATCRRHRDP